MEIAEVHLKLSDLNRKSFSARRTKPGQAQEYHRSLNWIQSIVPIDEKLQVSFTS